jgi:hypothetical protein
MEKMSTIKFSFFFTLTYYDKQPSVRCHESGNQPRSLTSRAPMNPPLKEDKHKQSLPSQRTPVAAIRRVAPVAGIM